MNTQGTHQPENPTPSTAVTDNQLTDREVLQQIRYWSDSQHDQDRARHYQQLYTARTGRAVTEVTYDPAADRLIPRPADPIRDGLAEWQTEAWIAEGERRFGAGSPEVFGFTTAGPIDDKDAVTDYRDRRTTVACTAARVATAEVEAASHSDFAAEFPLPPHDRAASRDAATREL